MSTRRLLTGVSISQTATFGYTETGDHERITSRLHPAFPRSGRPQGRRTPHVGTARRPGRRRPRPRWRRAVSSAVAADALKPQGRAELTRSWALALLTIAELCVVMFLALNVTNISAAYPVSARLEDVMAMAYFGAVAWLTFRSFRRGSRNLVVRSKLVMAGAVASLTGIGPLLLAASLGVGFAGVAVALVVAAPPLTAGAICLRASRLRDQQVFRVARRTCTWAVLLLLLPAIAAIAVAIPYSLLQLNPACDLCGLGILAAAIGVAVFCAPAVNAALIAASARWWSAADSG